MAFEVAIAAASVRSDGSTDDRVVVRDFTGGIVIVVADGASGIPGAGIAADAVVRGVTDAPVDALVDSSRLIALLRHLDDDVEQHRLAGESTAVITVVTERTIIGASCGDSQAWLVDDDSEELTANQSRKRIGSGRASPVGFSTPRRDGLLVVGSDGLFAYVAIDAIATVVHTHSPAAAAPALIAAARSPRGALRDDTAVAVVRV